MCVKPAGWLVTPQRALFMAKHLWLQELTTDIVLDKARQFCGNDIFAPGLSGPVLGDRIEAEFLRCLDDYDLTGKGPADLATINVDIKALQLRGSRGGSAKIHGYSKGGPPTYSLLIFTYTYDGESIHIIAAHFIPNERVKWVQAEHYLFSLPDRNLEEFVI